MTVAAAVNSAGVSWLDTLRDFFQKVRDGVQRFRDAISPVVETFQIGLDIVRMIVDLITGVRAIRSTTL